MTLSALIRKREIATATVATPATQEGVKGGTVANVASVAVANQLLAEEESAVRAWLAHIKETDPATVTEVITKCQRDPQARAYCLEQAQRVPPMITKAEANPQQLLQAHKGRNEEMNFPNDFGKKTEGEHGRHR